MSAWGELFDAFDDLFDKVDKVFEEMFSKLPPSKSRTPCSHSWRAAKTSKGPARHCYFCVTTEQLTEEEFYALFGPVLFT